MFNLLAVLPMILLLVYAAVEDMRVRQIRNWLTLTLAVTGIVNSLVSQHALVSPLQSIAGFGLALAIMVPMFVLRAVGGGDVKLIAAVGAWLGPLGMIQVLVIEKLVGLVIVLVQCAWQGKLTALFRNSATVAVNLVHLRELGVDHVSGTGQSCRSIDRPLPYAVPVLAGVLIVVTMFA